MSQLATEQQHALAPTPDRLGQVSAPQEKGGVTSTRSTPVHSQLNVTLNILRKDGDWKNLGHALAWLTSCLNCDPSHAEVEISQPTEYLCWPDFLDAPGFREEHPDYQAAVVLLRKVEAWLAMDRKQLVHALIQQHHAAEAAKLVEKTGG